ncbi:MAG: hypothetical protein QXH27_03550 [Candidatus Micrarchaeia archaeon]
MGLLEKQDVFLLAIVIAFAFAIVLIGFGKIDARTYPHLLLIESGSRATAFHATLAALKESAGGDGKAFLKSAASMLPVALAALSTAFVFLALLPAGRFHAFFAAVLYASSPLLLASSSSGVLLPETLGLFFSALATLLLLSSFRLHAALALPAGFCALAAALFDPEFFYAGLALLAASALRSSMGASRGEPVVSFLQPLFFLLPLAFGALAPLPPLSLFRLPSSWAILMFGLAAFPTARLGRIVEEEVFFGSLALFSLALSSYSGALAPVGLALAAGFAAGSTFSAERRPAAGLVLLAFLVFLSVLTAFIDPARSLAFSFVLAALVALVAWMYREKRALAAAAFYAVSLAVLLALSHGLLAAQFSKQDVGPDTRAAIAWASNLPAGATVALWGDEAAFEFESGLRVLGDKPALARYLLSNASAAELAGAGVSHIIIPFSVFDDFGVLREAAGSPARIDAFAPTGRYTQDLLYAEFSSSSGRMFYPTDPDTGNLIEGEAILEAGGGIPTGRLLLLKASNASGFASSDRFVYPRSGLEANLLKLFFPENFGRAAGVRERARENGLLVLEVAG